MARTTPETRAETRRRLLDVAAEHFARDGLEGANINEISTAAGFAKGTVYNHFPSKDALFAAVVEEACRLTAEAGSAVSTDGSTRERLRALIAADVAWAEEHPAFAVVLVRASLDPAPSSVGDLVIAAAAPYLQAVEGILAAGVDAGEIRDDIPLPQLVLLFAGLGQLTLARHFASGGAWPTFEEIPDLVVTAFLDGAGR